MRDEDDDDLRLDTGWVDLHAMLPGLRGTILHVVHAMDEARVRAKLTEAGYRLAVLDGARIVDEASFFQQVAPALGLPEFFGGNWDAYNDSLWGLCGSLAVLWRDCDRSFEGDAQTLFSAVMGLMDAGLEPARERGEETFRLAVFLFGSGPGFRPLES